MTACICCQLEPRDTSAKALIATLRKQLSLACSPLTPYISNDRVRRKCAMSGCNNATPDW